MNCRIKLLNDIIIAIDGYSSCGKSTLAKNIAKQLNYIHIDTGAMYRAITFWALENGYISSNKINEKELISSLNKIKIEFKYNENTQTNELWLNERYLEEEIRKPIISEYASLISQIKEVRKKMVELQQEMGKTKKIVMDGRDIGTVVFPNAELKIFMVADTNIRAKRRYLELKEKGINITLEEVIKNLQERDFLDTHREISPLKKADDAYVLDNSFMSKEEQLQWAIDLIKSKFTYEYRN